MNDEIIIINNTQGESELIVCGVLFLRARDVSRFSEGETYSERSQRINSNIKKHYEQIALNKSDEWGKTVPIIAMGHLSVAGSQRQTVKKTSHS